MDMNGNANYLYLNRDGHWPDFDHAGVELDADGAWQLATVPRLFGVNPPALASLPMPGGPAGVAVDAAGSVFYTLPEQHQLMRIDGCDGRERPFPCLANPGSQPAQLQTPRGLLFHTLRNALFVADSGNHRIQIFDADTFQLLEIWGQPALTPGADSSLGRFNQPWSLAEDAEGHVYVADTGNGRIQKFDMRGQVDPDFTANSAPTLTLPVQVAVSGTGAQTRIFVLDAGAGQIVVLDTHGQHQQSFGAAFLQSALGLAVQGDTLYVGDNSRRQVMTFRISETVTAVGPAVGFTGPVAGLALDDDNHLWLHPGWEQAPLWLTPDAGFVRRGVLWGGPFGPGQPVTWHQLQGTAVSLAQDAHLQFFVHLGNDATQPPAAPIPDSPTPFDHPDWQPLPPDVLNVLIGGEPARALWVGAHFVGAGTTSPHLAQLRVNFDHQTYRQHLPAIFSNPPSDIDFLDRFLSLFESFFVEAETSIAQISRFFDPAAVPAGWLSWLAGWLALEPDENWSEAQQRAAIAHAFAAYGRRGTAAGLRESLRLYAGVEAHIEEPILHAGWWALPADDAYDEAGTDSGLLGFSTMLAPVEADGAVLGGTAVLDRSHLIGQDDFGAPLFENVAHQFTVQVYRGQSLDLNKIETIVDAEKPAHTTYQICMIEPTMRIGFQARLGVDTIIAGPLSATPLAETSSANGVVLGGQPTGQIGTGEVGISTRLG